MKTTIAFLSLIIVGLIWFVEPWSVGVTKHAESDGISRSSPGHKASIGPIVSTQEPESAGKTTNLPTVESFPKEQSKPILSEQVQRALGDVKRTLEAMETARAEEFPCEEVDERGVGFVVVKLKKPEKEEMQRAVATVENARKHLSANEDDEKSFRKEIESLMKDFGSFELPFRALKVSKSPHEGKTWFAWMDTTAKGGEFMDAEGHLVTSGGPILRLNIRWDGNSVADMRISSRYGHILGAANGEITTKAGIRKAQQ